MCVETWRRSSRKRFAGRDCGFEKVNRWARRCMVVLSAVSQFGRCRSDAYCGSRSAHSCRLPREIDQRATGWSRDQYNSRVYGLVYALLSDSRASPRSSTQRLTARFPCPNTQALRHRSCLLKSPFSPLLGPFSKAPTTGPIPQSLHRRIAQPATPQISSQSTSNRTYQSAGRGMRRRRVVRRMAAQARTCAGWMA